MLFRSVHLAQNAIRCFAEYLAAFKTAIGACNDRIATSVVGSGIHHEQSTHQTASNDIPGHTNLEETRSGRRFLYRVVSLDCTAKPLGLLRDTASYCVADNIRQFWYPI